MDDLRLNRAKKKDHLDSLVQAVGIFSEEIKMSFALDRCAVMKMRRKKKSKECE